MKKFCLTASVGLFLFVTPLLVSAQDVTPNLDQHKLLHQLSGKWQRSVSKDTVEVSETKHYGAAFTEKVYYLVKGKKSHEYIDNYTYDPTLGKVKGFLVYSNGNSATWLGAFTSENKLICYITDNFNPDKVLGKLEIVFESPKVMDITSYDKEGRKTQEFNFHKVK